MLEPGREGRKRAAPAAAPRRPIFPNEIFLKILSYIQPSVEMRPAECRLILSQLSLVCSFFCTALRPRLFRRLLLGENLRTISRSEAFYEALMRGDERARALAVHIRTCRISGSLRRPGAAATMYHRALYWTTHIESLCLIFLDIHPELWSCIDALSELKTLQLSSMYRDHDVPAEEINCFEGLRLSSIDISESQVLSLPQIFNTTALSELQCDHGFLETLLTGGPISTLESLALSPSVNMQSLMKILGKVPSVRNFTIYSSITEGPGVAPEDFAALLPNLSSLTCPPSVLAFLAPSRPLVSLEILDEDTPLLDLGTVLGSHAPYTTITDLIIPPTVSLVAGHFPNLHKLEVSFMQFATLGPEAMTFISAQCEGWPIHPSVQQLHLPMDSAGFSLDLALQHTILTRNLLSQRFPALRWFKIGNAVEWERFAENEAWRVLVPSVCRGYIVARFDAGDPSVVDHGGHLQRLSAHARDIAYTMVSDTYKHHTLTVRYKTGMTIYGLRTRILSGRHWKTEIELDAEPLASP